jgi:acetyl-CoA C-acetyltransferase
MSRVAEGNPQAWTPQAISAEEIRDAGPRNPMLAFPYTRRHNSQWNVDQAAGLILCSLATARALGVPEERLVYPLAAADANHMVALSERRELHRSPGFRHAGQRCLEHAGLGIGDVAHRELYSCFPVAVRLQLRELGITDDRPVTVTGGMAFAGGPLNNFVLQAAVRMTQVLREDAGSTGMVNAVSGIMTKQGVTLWSTAPPERPFAFADVSEQTARDVAQVRVHATAEGDATVASYTVQYLGDTPHRTFLLCDLPNGDRALIASEDPTLAQRATHQDLCGETLRGDVR